MTVTSAPSVFLDMIGCRLNRAEVESLAAEFRALGCEIAARVETADLVVLNTCSVTGEAERDSRQKARQVHARNPRAAIALTGCWSTLQPEAAASLPGVRWVVGNADKVRLPGLVLEGKDRLPERETRYEALARRQHTRAFIPVQLGCDHACAYCVTRVARGPARSVPAEQVVADIRAAEEAGVMEVVLTGVQLGAWGKDVQEAGSLRTLLDEIFKRTHVPRIRLSSLEPWNVEPGFLEAWANPRLCPHLHLPLQSGSPTVLRRMTRPITPDQFARRVEEARGAIPDLAITSDILVGFPGESEAEFSESLDFVRRMRFASLHVFRFSPRPGTAAVSLPEKISMAEIRSRARIVEKLGRESTNAFLREYVGCEAEVLWESGGGQGRFRGWTPNAVRVRIESNQPLRNRLMRVRLMEILEGEMRGELTCADNQPGFPPNRKSPILEPDSDSR
jgi:threonylcarbamoyladenosine tRNA methylthiotransferase MtaB